MDVVLAIQNLQTTPESPTGEDRFRDQFLVEPVPLVVASGSAEQ
jgi:hypothetical protein